MQRKTTRVQHAEKGDCTIFGVRTHSAAAGPEQPASQLDTREGERKDGYQSVGAQNVLYRLSIIDNPRYLQPAPLETLHYDPRVKKCLTNSL